MCTFSVWISLIVLRALFCAVSTTWRSACLFYVSNFFLCCSNFTHQLIHLQFSPCGSVAVQTKLFEVPWAPLQLRSSCQLVLEPFQKLQHPLSWQPISQHYAEQISQPEMWRHFLQTIGTEGFWQLSWPKNTSRYDREVSHLTYFCEQDPTTRGQWRFTRLFRFRSGHS